jgi:hypothetical protein
LSHQLSALAPTLHVENISKPMKNIIAGILGFAVAVGLMIASYVYPYEPISPDDVVITNGRLSYVRIEEKRRNSDNIYIRLEGNPVTYRVDGSFAPRKVAQFKVGAHASISTHKKDLRGCLINQKWRF